MNARVFGLRSCDSCRKARKWLDANRIEHEFIDVREATPSIAGIKGWLAAVGDGLLNRHGTTWRQLSDADKARADKNLPALLHEHPALMKRPVLVVGNDVHVSFDEKAWRQLLKKNI